MLHVTHPQLASVSIFPEDLPNSLLYWLHDNCGLQRNDYRPLGLSWEFFSICATDNMHLRPGKWINKNVTRFGSFTTADGIRYELRKLDGLISMESSLTGAHLQKLIYAQQWVKNGVLWFIKTVTPLHDFFERVYDHAGRRTNKTEDCVSLDSVQWGQIELDAFHSYKKALENQVTLAHRDVKKRLCF